MLLRPLTVHISVIALFLHCRMTRSSSPNITLESVIDLEEKNITYRQEIDNDHFHLRKIKRDISKITFSCVAEGPIIWNFEVRCLMFAFPMRIVKFMPYCSAQDKLKSPDAFIHYLIDA
jgi:hypothetical protein